MSVTFYGRTAQGKSVAVAINHPAYLNMASANARTFLLFLGLEPGAEPSGEVGLPEARRAIMRARATFARRVGTYTRAGNDTKRPGRCRVIEGGIDADYFTRRLDDFERFLEVVAAKGARAIYWA